MKDPVEKITLTLTRSELRRIALALSQQASEESRRRAAQFRRLKHAEWQESMRFESDLRTVAEKLLAAASLVLVVVGIGCVSHSAPAHNPARPHPSGFVESPNGRCEHSRWYQLAYGGPSNVLWCAVRPECSASAPESEVKP